MSAPAAQAAERAARESFGRLIAYLSARSGDVAGAEDALGEALLLALERWHLEGVPAKPEAWLLTVARRRLIDRARRASIAGGAAERLQLAHEEAMAEAETEAAFPDKRLELLCACAHPSIDPAARTPLMLQTVFGLSGDRIASAFLTSPSSMTKRLTRAKAKIREAGVAFQVPSPDQLQDRLESVLAAIYAAYGLGWDAAFGSGGKDVGLAEEAIWLGRLVVGLVSNEPEPKGLLALMLFSEARRGARRSPTGAFVPVGLQDVSLWSSEMIDEAEALLQEASRAGRMGRYQLEAAIQAVHSVRRHRGHTDWHSILVLYEGLTCLSRSLGARVGRAAALYESGRPEEALTELDEIEAAMVTVYQPFWATRAHILEALNRPEEANSAFARAAGLSEDTAVRSYLLSLSHGPGS